MSNDDDDDRNVWGEYVLPKLIEALGEIEGEVTAIKLHFGYGQFAVATISRKGLEDLVKILELFGTGDVTDMLGAPKYLQALTLDIRRGQFMIVECRYLPLGIALDEFVATLTVAGKFIPLPIEELKREQETL